MCIELEECGNVYRVRGMCIELEECGNVYRVRGMWECV